MNTDIEAVIWCPEPSFDEIREKAEDWFRFVEERFSRFREGSELSHLNRHAGKRCMISDTMLEVLMLAEEYRRITAGIFDPLIAKSLIAAGYRESFDHLRIRQEPLSYISTRNETSAKHSIDLDPGMKSVVLPRDTQIDLGGIVKSWAVEHLSAWMQSDWGIIRGMVNAGGDLAVWGGIREEQADGWQIGIEHPWRHEEDIHTLHLLDGAAATSSKLGRNWLTDRGIKHHLIDPRSMTPSESDVVQCTVVGTDAISCEVWAKTICILGAAEGKRLFADRAEDYEAFVFTADRQMQIWRCSS